METYFFDWEVRNDDGEHVKWANTLSEAEDDVPPTEVFKRAKDDLYEDLGLPKSYHARAITFSRI